MRTLIYICALVGLVLMPSFAAASGTDCVYSYTDDFTTNKVVSDSYQHSAVLEVPYPIMLGGWLRIEPDTTGNLGLVFHYGSEPSSFAQLKYALPLDGSTGVTAGTVEFDTSPMTWETTTGVVIVYIGYEGNTRWFTSRLLSPGHYQFGFSPPQAVNKMLVEIDGGYFHLDNVSVCLDVATPTRGSTWGQLKSLYR